jgi:serine/threonine-protein kinase
MRLGQTPKPELIRQELARILHSASFSRASRLSRFLSFVVEQALKGNSIELKEYVLGVEVFDRKESFDPRLDPIVRVEAGRLRTKLQRYYEQEGQADGIHIECPKGGYAPVFWGISPSASSPPESVAIAVLPFTDLSPEGNQGHFCGGITEELISLLTQVSGIRVASRTSSFAFKGKSIDIRQIGRHLSVDLVLEGSVRKQDNCLRITAQLCDVHDGFERWSQTHEWLREDAFAVQKQFSQLVVEHLKAMLLEPSPSSPPAGETEDSMGG